MKNLDFWLFLKISELTVLVHMAAWWHLAGIALLRWGPELSLQFASVLTRFYSLKQPASRISTPCLATVGI